ncbi:MAG: type II toxin-antitoxin system VapC family toxin [Bacteroidota bacterium]
MKTLVLDAHALMKYFELEPGWDKVAGLLQQAADEKCLLLLTVVNWGEVFYMTLQDEGEESAQTVLAAIRQMPIRLVEANKELTLAAARFKARGGISYADCFAAGLGKLEKAEIVTGDKEFKVVEDEVKIRWM